MDTDQVNGNSIKRRNRVPNKPTVNISLWSVIKSFVGQDLTRLALPVNFNEPISMLQRSAEDYEYSELLDKAAGCKDIAEQLAHLAAFTMSTYSTTSERVAKPFNPLLGETYECDRISDMGWKLVSEQVSHHPPVLAQFCESINGWKCSQELALSSKFYGTHITAIPKTFSRVEFPATGTSFTFNRPTTSVHNLILGKLTIQQSGEVTIIGEGKAKGWKCVLTYHVPSSWSMSKDQRKVKGAIYDPRETLKMTLTAQWDDKMEMTVNGKSSVIWRKRAPPSDAHLYYNFTVFASQLNEMEDNVAPTDSRHRPDQRLMENGDWDASNEEKVRLEKLQRDRRNTGCDVKPIWFEQKLDEATGEMVYNYLGTYWEHKSSRDWSVCPKIF